MGETPDDLEASLERVIGRLTRPGAPREAKALAIDARRLRTLVGNWRTIAPTDEARREMQARVERLDASAEALLPGLPNVAARPEIKAPAIQPSPLPAPPGRPQTKAPAVVEEIRPGAIVEPLARPQALRPPSHPPAAAPRPDPEHVWDEPPSLVVPARSLLPSDEATFAAPIATMARAGEERAKALAAQQPDAAPAARPRADPVRARSLPDLDISGIAQLMEDAPGMSFDDALGADSGAGFRPARGDLDASRGRPLADDPLRPRPSPTPANGRRRVEAAPVADPTYSPGRPSRVLVDRDVEPGADSTASVYPVGSEEPPPRASVVRASSSTPPVVAHPAKTQIAVRPLPAPEVLDKRLVLLTEPFSARADAYRALRRKLSGPGAPRTIAVTSAQPEEGKTSCAVNLALAFRETSSEKVLLIEANLRAPVLAKLFGFEPPMCFAKQMAKNRDLDRASWTVVEQFEPLHVLAVDPASKTSPLLDPVAFANALEQLMEAGYDHIIVDTPPALGGSDVNLIADAVDGLVVVAWIKKSKKSLVKKAIEQLKPATILGVVTLDG